MLSAHVLTAIFGILLGADQSAQPATPGCEVRASGPAYFTSSEAPDVVEAEVVGNPCWKATLRIRISHGATVAYTYTSDFKRHTAMNWADPDLPKSAQDFVNDVVAEGMHSRERHLPPWNEDERSWGAEWRKSEVPEAQYLRYREARRPVFRHLTHYEEWRLIVFDSSRQEAVVVVEEGS